MPRQLLAIETSCDETSAAVVRDGELVSLVIASQLEHEAWGGVVPEIASRAHLRSIAPVIRQALERASIEPRALDAVAVTTEPGLIGSLLVGVNTAKGMAVALGVPLIAVHHIEAHLLSILLDEPDMPFPYLGLVVSGGHTLLYDVDAVGEYHLLGATRDDAAGEAFDKGAKLLGLGYPGGPRIDALARTGNPDSHAFPRTLVDSKTMDFSFSGLKTSLRYFLRDNFPSGPPEGQALADVCAAYQEAIVDTLVRKAVRAARRLGRQHLVVVGGVSVNSRLRQRFAEECERLGLHFHTVKPIYSTDNAAMIGLVGWKKLERNATAPLSVRARASMIRSTSGRKSTERTEGAQ